MKDLSIVKDDDSQLLKDVDSTAQIATPLKSYNPLKITASEEKTFTPDVKNHTIRSSMDHNNSSSYTSNSTLQNSGLLNSKLQNSTSISTLNPDDINAELLNLLVRCVTNQQVDNEIYKHKISENCMHPKVHYCKQKVYLNHIFRGKKNCPLKK